jgi:hypothetical protein
LPLRCQGRGLVRGHLAFGCLKDALAAGGLNPFHKENLVSLLDDAPNPYEHYIERSSETLPTAVKLRLQFEEEVVKFLLRRYGFADTRTRFCLLDLVKQQGHLGDGRWLTLASWNRFFPGFPIQLYGWRLTPNQRERSSFPAVWCDFWSSPFLKLPSDFLLTDARCPSPVHNYQEQLEELLTVQSSGIVYKWPANIPLKQSPVLLFDVPPNESMAAPTYLFRSAYGMKLAMEPLWAVLATVDNVLDPEHAWEHTALRKEHLESVEKS